MKKNFAKCVVFAALLTMGMTVVSSCKDDDTEITDPGTDVVTVDSTLLKSDAEVYKYIMGQFVELNLNGTLSERTRFYQQLNEADSTDIYARTATKADARRLFLQLLPSENAKLVKANRDSSEMSYAFSNGLRSLTYRESKSGNVVATVILPSEGNYQKYANSLTMVKTYGTNDGGNYYVGDILGLYREFEIPMYFANKPSWYYDTERDTCVQSPIWDPKDYQIQIRNKKVHMHCFYVDTYSDQAYFAFLSPCSVNYDLKDTDHEDYPYLVQHFQPYFLNPRNAENDVNYFVNADEFQNVDVLPSIDEIRTLFYALYPLDALPYKIRDYADTYMLFCTFLNNIDNILPDTTLIKHLGGDYGNAVEDEPPLYAECLKENEGVSNNYVLLGKWVAPINSNDLADFTSTMQIVERLFMYYTASDKWEIVNNSSDAILKYPDASNISSLLFDYASWVNVYKPDQAFDFLQAFASKDYYGKGLEGREYDESDYFFASQCTYKNSVTNKQDTAKFNERNNQWTVIAKDTTGFIFQKFYTSTYLDTAQTHHAETEEAVYLKGRNVLNATPLRTIYIKKVKISELGIQGLGTTHINDEEWLDDERIEGYLRTYAKINKAIRTWKQDKSERGIVY